MATYIPVTNLPTQFMDNSGDPLVGGSLEFYLAGTTTATDLFTSDGTSIGTSIELNSWGYPESGGSLITLFRDQSKALKVVAKNAAGATIYTTDNIPAVASFDSTASAKLATIEESADVTDATNVAAAGAFMADGSVDMSDDLTMGAATFILGSTATGITAGTTQTQAGATALTSQYNNVTVCATAGDGVELPTPVAGKEVSVKNSGLTSLSVYPPSSVAINALAVNIPMTLQVGSVVTFKAISTALYETNEVYDLSALVMTAGSGITSGTGTLYYSSISKVGDMYVTKIFIDLTGLASSTTDLDIIGAGANSHIGQITAAKNGTIFMGTVTCLETPAGGVTDIIFYEATESTGAFDGGIAALTNEIVLYDKTSAQAGAINTKIALTTLPSANKYLYLVNGAAGTPATYTAGQFMLEFWGI